MRRFILFTLLLIALFPVSAYEYTSDSYVLKDGTAFSPESGDRASVSGDVITSSYQGRTFSRTLAAPSRNTVVTGDVLIDALTRMAFEEAAADINKDGLFAAGAKWPTAWTRDMSYAADLSLSFLFPRNTEQSLASRVEDGVILQDTGSGGSYPVSTDRIVWGRAATAYALYAHDESYAKHVYDVIAKTLEQDYQVVYDPVRNVFRGETSFLDWREQTYPRWMTPAAIGESFALGTNAVYYSVLCREAMLAEKYGAPGDVQKWKERAGKLRDGIISSFWIPEKKYFGAYYINEPVNMLYEGYETLGESLAVLEGIVPGGDDHDVLGAVGPGRWGTSVVAPQLSGVRPYHNDAVWPFVQAYRCLALKKAGDYALCEKEFASAAYAASLFRTFRENYTASTCDKDGTELSSDRQLWSVAAWLSLMYRVICGIDFTQAGLSVHPLVFDSFTKGITLADFNWSGSTLDLSISGTGSEIASYSVNGQPVPADYVIPYEAGKKYDVRIVMKKSDPVPAASGKPAVLTSDVTSLVPVLTMTRDGGSIDAVWNQKSSDGWNVYRNGKLIFHTDERELTVKPSKTLDVYTVTAPSGNLPVLPGTPVRAESPKNTWFIEAENAAVKGGNIVKSDGTHEKYSADLQPAVNSGDGFVEEWGGSEGDCIEFSYTAPADGEYLVDFRFNNALGPVNTGDRCAIRTLRCDGTYVRRILFPQLGSRSLWDFTAPVSIHLSKGRHAISIVSDEWCYSQHHRLNPVAVDMMRTARK